MSKKTQISLATYAPLIDWGSLFLAILFLVSVIKNAAVAAGNMVGGDWGTAPLSYALILGLILIFINWYNSKGKVTTVAVIALTIFLTSSVIWIFGLHGAWPVGDKILNTGPQY